ncbi:MAG: histidine kinase [Bacteroidales bacterium]|jgi:signal transduction histidine kinase|nr:histidine kinase [Bacteroidales bacterium]
MFYIILRSISIILQCIAAFFAFSLIKRTKFNASWILISIAFLLIALRSTFDLFYSISNESVEAQSITSISLSVVIALLTCIGSFFIRKIFDLQQRIDDIRKKNESQLFAAIIRTEEHERLRFAKELHDGLGPVLSSIKMILSALNQSVENSENKEIIQKTNFVIDEAIITLKEISNKLSPHILTNFGLEKALRNFIDTLRYNKTLSIDFQSNIPKFRFESSIETVLYRVVCELISNTIRHAQAQQIAIVIRYDNQRLTIDYTDDGIGFQIDTQHYTSMGISNMQSRIKSIHGTIDFESHKNKGIRVRIIIDNLPTQ